MSSFEKKCDRCGKQIIMSNNTGKWGPYELDNSPHRCGEPVRKEDQRTAEKAGVIAEVNQEQQQKQQEGEQTQQTLRLKFNQHRVIFLESESENLQDRINAATAKNDSQGYLHRGVTLTFNPTIMRWGALIHYEIPAENNKP